jgi:hypothetical protein
MGSSESSQKIQINDYGLKPVFFVIKKINYFLREGDEMMGMYNIQTKVHELSGTLMRKQMTLFLTGTNSLYGMFKPANDEYLAIPIKRVPAVLININKTTQIEILYQNIGVLYNFTENYVNIVIMYNKKKLYENMFRKKNLEPFNPFYINCASNHLIIDFLQGYCNFDKVIDFKCIKTIDSVNITTNECSNSIRKIIPSKDYNIKFDISIINILGHLFPPDIKFNNISTSRNAIIFNTNQKFDINVYMYEPPSVKSYFLKIVVIIGDIYRKKIMVNINISDLIKTHVIMYNSSTRIIKQSEKTDFEYVIDWIAKYCITHNTCVNVGFENSTMKINCDLISGVQLFVKTDLMLKNKSFVETKKKIHDLFYSH